MRIGWLPATLLCALLGGCAANGGYGNGDDDDDDDVVSDDDDDDDDDGVTTPVMPDAISVGETDAMVTLPFGMSATGSGTGLIGAVDVAANAGTIAIQGTSLAIAFYEKQPWPEFGYTLYQGIAVGASRWDVVWLYCSGSTLSYVWHEGMTGIAIDYVNASGTCADSGASTATTVELPAMELATPPAVPGYSIDGVEIALPDGESGLVRIEGVLLPFVPFSVIDCTACGGDGWYELHSVAWDEDLLRAVFVIFYLDFAYPDRVLAAYARSIPDFADPVGVLDLDATWTAPVP